MLADLPARLCMRAGLTLVVFLTVVCAGICRANLRTCIRGSNRRGLRKFHPQCRDSTPSPRGLSLSIRRTVSPPSPRRFLSRFPDICQRCWRKTCQLIGTV